MLPARFANFFQQPRKICLPRIGLLGWRWRAYTCFLWKAINADMIVETAHPPMRVITVPPALNSGKTSFGFCAKIVNFICYRIFCYFTRRYRCPIAVTFFIMQRTDQFVSTIDNKNVVIVISWPFLGRLAGDRARRQGEPEPKTAISAVAGIVETKMWFCIAARRSEYRYWISCSARKGMSLKCFARRSGTWHRALCNIYCQKIDPFLQTWVKAFAIASWKIFKDFPTDSMDLVRFRNRMFKSRTDTPSNLNSP